MILRLQILRENKIVYSDVVRAGWILPKKKKYTMADVKSVIISSLFMRSGRTMTVTEAAFVVKCSAMYHDAEYSKNVAEVEQLN